VEMKESHPLDDLAEVITERVNAKLTVALDRLKELGWLDASVLETCHIDRQRTESLSLPETLCVGVLSRIRRDARPEELELVQRSLQESLKKGLVDRISEEGLRLHLLRKRVSGGGMSAEISFVVISHEGTLFDPDSESIEVVDLKNVLERIKLDLAREEEPTDRADGGPGSEGKAEEEQ
jgi:hypothetical protein